MTNTSKRCLLNTDLRSVSNAALRKLWHSYQRFWNAPKVVLIIIAHWKKNYLSLKSALADTKCSSNFLDVWLRGRFWLGLVKTSGMGGVGVICVCGSSMDAKMTESVEYGFCEEEETACC